MSSCTLTNLNAPVFQLSCIAQVKNVLSLGEASFDICGHLVHLTGCCPAKAKAKAEADFNCSSSGSRSGRRVLVTEDVSPGEVLIPHCSPLAVGVLAEFHREVCVGCARCVERGAAEQPPCSCSRCGLVRYCSESCRLPFSSFSPPAMLFLISLSN